MQSRARLHSESCASAEAAHVSHLFRILFIFSHDSENSERVVVPANDMRKVEHVCQTQNRLDIVGRRVGRFEIDQLCRIR